MKLKYILILLTITAFARQAFAQSKPGFVRQENIKVAGILADSQIDTLSVTRKQTTRSYYDGLGRTVQTIGVNASPLQNDLIQPVAYDNLGRQTIGYLPYAGQSTDTMGSYRINAISTAQPAFYNQTTQYIIATDAAPYTQSVFESSPLQRLLQAGTVGSGFQPVSGQHYKTVSYRPNNSTPDGNILVWNPDGTFTTGNYYANNTLAVTDGKDEDNIETLSFTDLAGHTILKRQILSSGNLDTYYIYGNAGMLKYIIPPLATNKLAANSYNLTTAPLSNLIFYFIYDTMGRLVQKTVPAKGVMYIVYDPVNRPVLMQDANMRVNNKWNYIKYDSKGRVISQGIYTDGTRTSLSAMQTYVSGLSYTSAWGESRSSTLSNGGYYTNVIFPTGLVGGTSITPLAYAYYDDYYMTEGASPDFSYVSQGLPNEETATLAAVKGAPTITSKTTVGAGIPSGTWLTTVFFYDKRGNPTQTQSNNQLDYTNATTLTDTKTTVPDFTGVPQVSKVFKRTSSTATVTVQTNLTYDHMYRIQNVTQSYNGGTTSTVAAYSYNELGQVIKKGLGFISGTTYLQNVNMRYSVRGQLLYINNSKLANDGGVTSNESNDVFGMQMLYDKRDTLGNTPYYNGKLSAVKWMSKNASGTSTYERAYKYSYDGINRYTASSYAERTVAGTGSFSNNIGGFDESGITYDVNGNILTLKRNASQQGTNTHHQIDSLVYSYNTANPDQLLNVTDGLDTLHTDAGFRNLTGSTGNYSYDGNGNLTADPYKGLSLISYDVLNRTDKISFTSSVNRYITYTYDASGSLLRKQQFDNVSGVATLQNTTNYIDGFVYLTAGAGTAGLSYFPMPEGRVLYNGSTFTQEFIITDQQGNARVSFQNNGSNVAVVKQENSYYAFGLIMPESPVPTPGTPNKQLYNGGSEWQNDYSNLPDYYQTFNRNYDPAIGRFIGVDSKAESKESTTSYNYAGNNPIMYNDPLGDTQRPAWTEGYITHNTVFSQPNGSPEGEGVAPYDGSDAGDYYGNTSAVGGDYSAFWGALIGGVNDISGLQSAYFSGSLISGMYNAFTTAINSGEESVTFVNDPSSTTVYGGDTQAANQRADQGDNQGGNPGNPGNLYHISGNLPPYDQKLQQGGTCVFCTTAESIDYFTGDKLTGMNVLEMYSRDENLSNRQEDALYNNGIWGPAVFKDFLCSAPTNNVIGSLLSDYPVAAYINQPGGRHEVWISGFSFFSDGPNAGFNYTFYNSQTNHYENLPPSNFHQTYEITGAK